MGTVEASPGTTGTGLGDPASEGIGQTEKDEKQAHMKGQTCTWGCTQQTDHPYG